MPRTYAAPAAEAAAHELTADPHRPDTAIAAAANCSPSTVQRVRADLAAAQLIPLTRQPGFSPNPHAYDRAALALQDNPARSNALIAQLSDCTVRTVGRARHDLEQTGLIRYVPAQDRLAPLPATPPRPQATRAAAALIDAPARSDALIAAEAGCSTPTVYRARVICESMGLIAHIPPPQRADRRGDRVRPLHDAAAATDAITVSKPARARRPPPMPKPYIPELPPAPDWARGTCANVPPAMRSWWTSARPTEREAAALACASCPIRQPCEDWSVSLPADDSAVYGGLTKAERLKRKRELRAESTAKTIGGLAALRAPTGVPWQQAPPR